MRLFGPRSGHCGTVRTHLDACIDGQASIETLRFVVEHLRGCGECSRDLAKRRSLKLALQRAVHNVPFPQRLERRVRRSIRGFTRLM